MALGLTLVWNAWTSLRGAIGSPRGAAVGNQVVERSSITEFIQYANGIKSAAYYHVFKDANGNPLDGTNPPGYVLTFPKGQLPEAMRFWSLTAYTPEAIELVPNPANKYAVASYTPPQFNADDSVSIYMAQKLPAGVPMANWLPIPPGAFNIMLRVYGPEGTVEDNTYVPPGMNGFDIMIHYAAFAVQPMLSGRLRLLDHRRRVPFPG